MRLHARREEGPFQAFRLEGGHREGEAWVRPACLNADVSLCQTQARTDLRGCFALTPPRRRGLR